MPSSSVEYTRPPGELKARGKRRSGKRKPVKPNSSLPALPRSPILSSKPFSRPNSGSSVSTASSTANSIPTGNHRSMSSISSIKSVLESTGSTGSLSTQSSAPPSSSLPAPPTFHVKEFEVHRSEGPSSTTSASYLGSTTSTTSAPASPISASPSPAIYYPKYRPDNMIRIPLKVPWKRRLETIVVMVHSTSLVLFTFLFFFLWCFPVLWPFMTIYTIFFFLLDRTPANGNSPRRYSKWVRNLGIYQYLSSYFPITLHKTVDLKPTFVTKSKQVQVYNTVLRYIVPDFVLSVLFRLYLIGKTTKSIPVRVRNGPRYVFGYHPHGVIAMGITGGFTMEGANFSNLFPGIRCFVTTLVNQFTLPFYRDYLMSLGVTSVTKKNLKSILRQDNSIVIVVGGATESLYSRPGLNTLVLRKRKGFIKLALEMCGVSDSDKFTSADDDIALVPVYGFGENNIYDVYYTNDSSNSSDGYIRRVLRYWQLWLKRKSGFTLPIVVSRGIFNYDFGVLPFRRPIDVVFGEPIAVKRMYGNKPGDAVTDEELAYYHGLYVEQLVRMFERNRGKYLTKWDKGLEIVE